MEFNHNKYFLCDPLEKHLNALIQIRNGFLSSLGPKGRSKIFQTCDEDDVKVGSSSALLIESLSLNQQPPIIRLIFAGIKDHLTLFNDFGLYASVLCLTVLINAHGDRPSVSCPTSAKCYQIILDEAFRLLDDHETGIVKNAELTMNELNALVSGIVQSKPDIIDNGSCVNSLIVTLLQSYISSIPSSGKLTDWPTLHYQPNSSLSQSKHMSGFLLDLKHQTKASLFYTFRKYPSHRLESKAPVIVYDIPITFKQYCERFPGNVSLSSDNVHFFTRSYQKFLISLGDALVSSGVRALLNIKVIDEDFKVLLETNDIICIDRIGSSALNPVKTVTGCKVNYDLGVDDLNLMLGSVDLIGLASVDKNIYVQLVNKTNSHNSAVICYGNPAVEVDVKQVCEASLTALDKTFQSRKILVGGGDFELVLTKKLTESLSFEALKKMSLPCSVYKFTTSLNSFVQSLEMVGKHLKRNQTTSSSSLLDCYQSKINAFKLAIQVACVVLDIKYQIVDR